MKTTVTELAAKLQRIENEVAEVRRDLEQMQSKRPLTEEEWMARRLERVRAENEKLLPYIDAAFRAMGVSCEPVSAEMAQRAIAESGINPEENLFSRGIIEMREE